MHEKLEFIDYLKIGWKRKGLIILGTLCCMVVSILVSILFIPRFEAEGILLIGKTATPGGLDIAFEPVKQLKHDIKTIPFLIELKKRTGLKYSLKKLRRMISIGEGENALNIAVSAKSYNDAKLLIQTIGSILEERHRSVAQQMLDINNDLLNRLEEEIHEIELRIKNRQGLKLMNRDDKMLYFLMKRDEETYADLIQRRAQIQSVKSKLMVRNTDFLMAPNVVERPIYFIFIYGMVGIFFGFLASLLLSIFIEYIKTNKNSGAVG